MNNTLKQLTHNQSGMSLSTTIALGFAGAVGLVFIIGLIVYFVKS